jgi:hypothetical protein
MQLDYRSVSYTQIPLAEALFHDYLHPQFGFQPLSVLLLVKESAAGR